MGKQSNGEHICQGNIEVYSVFCSRNKNIEIYKNVDVISIKVCIKV